MSQAHATSAEIIYNTLTEDVTFMNLVGKRIFKTGSTELDAISISSPGENLPGIKSINGLEVIIHDVSQLQRRNYITDEYDIMITWKIFLLAWPGANGSTLNSAASRIMQLFSKAETIETNPVPGGLGAIAQLLVLVPSDSIVLAS